MSAGKSRRQSRFRHFNAAVISAVVRAGVQVQFARDRFPGICLFSGAAPGCRVMYE